METPIEWSAPWFVPLARAGRAVAAARAETGSLPEALNRAAPGPLRAVAQSDLPEAMAYEAFIASSASVPTRENLHDLFNGLIWHTFPRSKLQLNRLQSGAIAAQGVGAIRGPLRDAITVFDENAALLQAPPALWAALRARDWQRLFVSERALWSQARLVLFGHALLEKLAAPYKSITAHVFVEPVPAALGAHLPDWDVWLAERLQGEALERKPFTPLPVLGVPGWWPANEDPAFYADAQVFRPPRTA
ncbi:MAG: DUF3025 domain-containing protein [Hydrogenophaga sp.]|uniref:DUF3025 domain-containing protein n=1 Tax=Hydrogenophaga sp. TaxID=1904254 RepID=UPI001D55C61C|nr:DUF3025 domain-containing protein [Hydrogenophaga sp.]MBX3611914.1 DUF3025 domain-containing protein [Hydrogenophaga sp.]